MFGFPVNFVVIPVGRNPKFGFWLQARDAEEARKLVALNVPQMEGVIDPGLAHCKSDDSYSPMHGVIIEGSGRSYTITRRTDKNRGAILPCTGSEHRGLEKDRDEA